jgi:hypothetical protein
VNSRLATSTQVGRTKFPAAGTHWSGCKFSGGRVQEEDDDLLRTPKAIARGNPMLAANAAHLARRIKTENGIEGGR